MTSYPALPNPVPSLSSFSESRRSPGVFAAVARVRKRAGAVPCADTNRSQKALLDVEPGGGTMSEIRNRLEKGVAVLQELEQKRRETCTPKLGYDTEFVDVATELSAVAEDVLREPGAQA